MGSYQMDSYDQRYERRAYQKPLKPGADNFVRESFRQNNFWLRIMQEHALFIRLGLPCDETKLIREAEKLEELFKGLRAELRRLPHNRRLLELLMIRLLRPWERLLITRALSWKG